MMQLRAVARREAGGMCVGLIKMHLWHHALWCDIGPLLRVFVKGSMGTFQHEYHKSPGWGLRVMCDLYEG